MIIGVEYWCLILPTVKLRLISVGETTIRMNFQLGQNDVCIYVSWFGYSIIYTTRS